MYRTCIVHELDTKRHFARVEMPDRDGVVSGWLQVLVRSTHGDKEYGLPKVGNQVACIFDDNDEAGCVLGAVYSEADPPTVDSETIRRFEFEDGGSVEYDRATHVLRVVVPAGGTLELAGNAKHVALAEDVKSELTAIKSELQSIATALSSHTHAGVLSGPAVSGTAPPVYTVGYDPSDVAAAQVKSA